MGYFIFALTTGLTALFTLLKPTLFMLEAVQPLNQLIQYKFITYFTFAILAILAAPLLLFPTIFPTYSKIFQDTLLASIKD